MKTERANVEFPLWRKKVDASLFKDAATPVPNWLWPVWDIEPLFSQCVSKDNSKCHVKIYLGKKEFQGRVINSEAKGMYRLFFTKELSDILKDTFVMSYMRSIEQDLRRDKPEYLGQEIEDEIPFWEFLDIEFDSNERAFYFKAYYIQKPAFSELFRELVKSHTLRIIDDVINSKGEFRFIKQDWQPREKLRSQINARNIIYNLIDTKNKMVYIGEGESLNQRLNQNREVIKDWDFYRFDCLPEGLTKTQRIAIERLLIRTFASFFNNKRGISTMAVSEYSLANQKIDI